VTDRLNGMTAHPSGGARWSLFFLMACIALSGLAGCKGGPLGELGQTVKSIQITPASPVVATGASLKMTATATYSDGNQLDVTSSATWSSSNTAVATIKSAGQVVAVSTGITTIDASFSGVDGTTQLSVTSSGAGVPPGYAYVTSADTQGQKVPGAILQYTIGSDGTLAPMSVASVPTGIDPTTMVSDPSGNYVYVANAGDATISQYVIGTGGALVPLTPNVVRIPAGGSYSLTANPKGSFLYVVIGTGSPSGSTAAIAQFSIGSNGTLAPLAEPAVTIATPVAGSLTFDSGGQFGYLAAGTSTAGQVIQFSVNSDGSLLPLSPATVAASATAVGVSVALSGLTAYVLSSCIDSACDAQITQFTIGSTGQLTSVGATTLNPGSSQIPVAMVTSGAGSNAYLLANPRSPASSAGLVFQYTIDSGGGLALDTPNSLSLTSRAVAESTYGSNLYALGANSTFGGSINQYTIQSDGLLTAGATTSIATGVPTATSQPTAITLVVAH
jgi:6-phosphogluconolactonase (cycloisomerase 2 family)